MKFIYKIVFIIQFGMFSWVWFHFIRVLDSNKYQKIASIQLETSTSLSNANSSWVNYLNSGENSSEPSTVLRKIQSDILNGLLNSTEAKIHALNHISTLLQKQLHDLETVDNCDETTTFYCDQPRSNGFGHQVLNRVLCVLIAYNLKIPLIHGKGRWQYKADWNELFIHTGSHCGRGPNTITMDWDHGGRIIGSYDQLKRLPGCCTMMVNMTTNSSVTYVAFPFWHKSPIPDEFENILKQLHPKHFFAWWIGQFTTYILKLQPVEQEAIGEAKKAIIYENGGSVTIGMHIRRTDKVEQKKSWLKPIRNYFNTASLMLKAESRRNSTLFNNTVNVFIASDDPSHVFPEAEALVTYTPTSTVYDIIGFKNESTMSNPGSRVNGLNAIVRDIFLLVQSDFVVCTLSSNVCRVVWALMATKYYDLPSRVHSLDDKYYYRVCCGLRVKVPKIYT